MWKAGSPHCLEVRKKPSYRYDMYPQYWTPSIGGILMKYSYKFKRQCVELYRQGKWPETPKDITEKIFTIQSEFGFG